MNYNRFHQIPEVYSVRFYGGYRHYPSLFHNRVRREVCIDLGCPNMKSRYVLDTFSRLPKIIQETDPIPTEFPRTGTSF